MRRSVDLRSCTLCLSPLAVVVAFGRGGTCLCVWSRQHIRSLHINIKSPLWQAACSQSPILCCQLPPWQLIMQIITTSTLAACGVAMGVVADLP